MSTYVLKLDPTLNQIKDKSLPKLPRTLEVYGYHTGNETYWARLGGTVIDIPADLFHHFYTNVGGGI